MKIITVFVFLIFYTGSVVFSQDWAVYSLDEELKIEYKKVECFDMANGISQENILFKYTNLTDTDIKREIVIIGTYNKKGKVYKSQSDLSNMLTLSAGKWVEGNCGEKENYLCLFSRMLNIESSELIEFEVKLK